jgi:DNA invertase Pin-like site-specific DNA recombinase
LEPTRAVVYLRVSTSNQSVENQRHDLERVAAARGWNIVAQFRDDGISGAKSRSNRPALDALLKAAVRGEFDVIAVWALDRLARNLQHLVEIVNELQSLGIDLYVHQQAIDTSTPAGRLAFQIFGALSEYERTLVGERVKAGIERARRNGTKLGRPTNLNASVRAAIVALRSADQPIRKIAAQLRVGTGTVYRVLADAA